MVESSDELERMNREQLVLKARVLGVERAELMTRVELRDEIVRRSEPDLAQQKRARGFLGVARDLVASVVEAGLNLPDAAALIRGDGSRENDWKGPPPVATVTLAEIYATQGHLERALRMLDEVLAKEPDHDPARALRDRLAAGTDLPTAAPRRRQRISFAETPAELEPEVAPAPANASPPDAVAAPEVASVPDAVAAPEVVSVPEVASAPDAVAAPEVVSAPEAAVSPDAVAAPEPAVAPPAERAPESAIAAEPAASPVPAATLPAAAPAAAQPVSLVTLSVSGQRQVYWEVPASAWAAVRARSPNGRALLRVVSFRTRRGKVEREAQDLTPRGEVGSAVLPGLRADAVVRAVLGWESEGRFQPFLIATDLAPATPSSKGGAAFHAHPLVGGVAPGVEERALLHLTRR